MQKEYYMGKEYIEDLGKQDVIIQYYIKIPVIFKSFNISVFENIKINQIEGGLQVSIKKVISKKLFNDITNSASDIVKNNNAKAKRKYTKASRFIAGYISSSFPLIANEIQKKKYLEGHLLIGTVSLLDITEVIIISKKNKQEKTTTVGWSIVFSSFPPSSALAQEADAIFIRDLIDAMTCYFRYDINEGIRKIITSLECYWISHSLKKENFKKLIDLHVIEKNYAYEEHNLKIIRKNIKYIYNIRNLIVHDKLRLRPNDIYLLKVAIGSLSYLYQSKFMSTDQFNYIFSLVLQFLSIDFEFNNFNLDDIKEQEEAIVKSYVIINNKKDMDNFMFNGLRLSNKYINEINNNYNINLKY